MRLSMQFSAIISLMFSTAVLGSPPQNVTNFKAEVVGNDSIMLTWDPCTHERFSSYNIVRKETYPIDPITSPWFEFCTEVDTLIDTCQIEDLTWYTYSVQATTWDSQLSEESWLTFRSGDTTPPDSTTNIAIAAYLDRLNLYWRPSKNPDIWKYRIYRCIDGGPFSLHAEVIHPARLFEDYDCEPGVMYGYAVSAVDSTDGTTWNQALEGVRSVVKENYLHDQYAPDKPYLTTCTPGNKCVKLVWKAVSDLDLKNYIIFRSTDSLSFSVIDSVTKDVLSYTDLQVANGVTYYYHLCAKDTNNNQSYVGRTLKATPFNIKPVIQLCHDTIIHHTPGCLTVIDLSIRESIDPDGLITGYQWFQDGVLVDTLPTLNMAFSQGSHRMMAVVTDNDGATDTTFFLVSIDAGYYAFDKPAAVHPGITDLGLKYVFVPEANGTMQLLSGSFDKVIDVAIAGEISSVSSVSSDTVLYLSSTEKTLHCFDKRGIPLWSLPLGGYLKASVTIDIPRDRVYVGVSNNNLFGIDRSQGKVVWSYRASSPISQPGIVTLNQQLIFVTDNGTVLLFDLNREPVDKVLTPSGSLDLDAPVSSAAAVDKEGFIYVVSTNQQLVKMALGLPSMVDSVLWSVNIDSPCTTAPVIGYDGTLYIGGSDGLLHAFDGSDGSEKWSCSLGSPITSTVSLNEYGSIYVGTKAGVFFALSESGEQLWNYVSGSAIANATAYSEGFVLFANQNGELFKVLDPVIANAVPARIEAVWSRNEAAVPSNVSPATPIDKRPQWGTYQGNNRRSGAQADAITTHIGHVDDSSPFSIVVSPNPFTTSLSVRVVIDEASMLQWSLYDMFGKQLMKSEVGQLAAGQHWLQINGSTLQHGIYLLRVMAGREVISTKVFRE